MSVQVEKSLVGLIQPSSLPHTPPIHCQNTGGNQNPRQRFPCENHNWVCNESECGRGRLSYPSKSGL